MIEDTTIFKIVTLNLFTAYAHVVLKVSSSLQKGLFSLYLWFNKALYSFDVSRFPNYNWLRC